MVEQENVKWNKLHICVFCFWIGKAKFYFNKKNPIIINCSKFTITNIINDATVKAAHPKQTTQSKPQQLAIAEVSTDV